MIQIPEKVADVAEIPFERIEEACGIFTRSVLLVQQWTLIPQHEHDQDHATLVCTGRARAWADGAYLGEFDAGSLVPVKARTKHVFQAMEANTRLACISTESLEGRG